MATELVVRIGKGRDQLEVKATLEAVGAEAAPRFSLARSAPGTHLLLTGDRDYYVKLKPPLSGEALDRIAATKGSQVVLLFTRRSGVRRLLADLATTDEAVATPAGVALDLTAGLADATPLWLLADGRFSSDGKTAPAGIVAHDILVTAARWISTRRTSTFERLFPPSAFHPDQALRKERLSIEQAGALLAQLRSASKAAAVGGAAAKRDPLVAAETRSAVATVLSHLVATVRKDAAFRAVADQAAGDLFALADAEAGDETARPALRAHVINLLQLRGPALSANDKARAKTLLASLVRAAPPYAELKGGWRFAMCSDYEFHQGEVDVLKTRYHFAPIPTPADAPKGPSGNTSEYAVLEAPFKTPAGDPIHIYARAAYVSNENYEMGRPEFHGLLINRHAQLGSFDLRASTVEVKQQGYKIMMNSQCAGLTTRFAISRMFPDADIYSSWDSTYFNTDGLGGSGKVTASEGLDCFVAMLEGMAKSETHLQLSARIRGAQWFHKQQRVPGFVQFIGPSHPLVVAKYNDLNQDGRADYYDGYLDFSLKDIAEDMQASATPRDPGVAASQLSGEAARGLDWASGSLNRVTQYSDIWGGLPGEAENLYAFVSAGFYSQKEPPRDVPTGAIAEDLGRLPAVCRYQVNADSTAGLEVEVMLHSYLGHAAKEFKRLMVAAEAMWRAFDLGHLPKQGPLATPLGQRGAVLLTLAGLLEFPADQNFIDGLWSLALTQLNFPDVSRSTVRQCITQEDHDASNYYGSYRGLKQLIGERSEKGALEKADPVMFAKLGGDDPTIGRAKLLAV